MGFASIYLWRNVTKHLSEDYLNSPRKMFDDLGRLLIRLGNSNESLSANSCVEEVCSFLHRLKNAFSNIPVLMNNNAKLENIFQENFKQKALLFDKSYDCLDKTKIVPIRSTTNFQDIKGFDNPKNELISYISTFKVGPSSCLDQKSLTKGCVLFGPPKFERTVLVHALACEMKMGLFEISSLSLDGSFYCNGKKIEDVQDIVNQASTFSPCILFFDNYDTYEDDNTDFLSSLIIELDKCEASKRIAVIVATSRLQNIPRNVTSLTRFGTIVQLVDNLNFNKRKEVFSYHTSNIPIDSTIDVDLVITATAGMNARQIKYLVGRSARKAKLQNRCKVTTQDVCYTLLMEKLKTSKKISRPTFPPPPIPARACPPPPNPSPVPQPRKKTQKTTTKLQQYTSQFNFVAPPSQKQIEEPVIR